MTGAQPGKHPAAGALRTSGKPPEQHYVRRRTPGFSALWPEAGWGWRRLPNEDSTSSCAASSAGSSPTGGFKWSSQHLVEGSCNGQGGSGLGAGGSGGDAVAGRPSVGRLEHRQPSGREGGAVGPERRRSRQEQRRPDAGVSGVHESHRRVSRQAVRTDGLSHAPGHAIKDLADAPVDVACSRHGNRRVAGPARNDVDSWLAGRSRSGLGIVERAGDVGSRAHSELHEHVA
jgi:hypothetical protein